MLKATAPSDWFESGLTQEQWEKKETKDLKDLEKAINILEAVISK